MDALELMMRFEEDGLRFYEKMDNSIDKRGMTGLYGLLADSQKRQMASLAAMRGMSGTGVSESIQMLDDDRFVSGFSRLLHAPDIRREMKFDRDAFLHVMHAEEEMIKLCEGMARLEANMGSRALLAQLAENERRHMLEVEEIYEFVESPRCYLEWGEFSNLHPL